MDNRITISPVDHTFIEVMKEVDRIADTNLPVLLIGESGCCRELVASMIHHRSSRREQPFVAVDCGHVQVESMEADLFGLLEPADGGTVLVDAIAETTDSFQTKLLRLLQTREISESQRIDVRLIAGSHCNLKEEVAAGRFSDQLFSYLSQGSIVLPSRGERRSSNNDWVTMSIIEGRYVARVLEHTAGNKQAAARLLAVDRKTLDRMIKRHHIDFQHVRMLRAKASQQN